MARQCMGPASAIMSPYSPLTSLATVFGDGSWYLLPSQGAVSPGLDHQFGTDASCGEDGKFRRLRSKSRPEGDFCDASRCDDELEKGLVAASPRGPRYKLWLSS